MVSLKRPFEQAGVSQESSKITLNEDSTRFSEGEVPEKGASKGKQKQVQQGEDDHGKLKPTEIYFRSTKVLIN